MNILKKHFFAVSILFVFLFSASAAECDPPGPFRIGGNVTVDGSKLTMANDSGYTFVVTDQNGNDYIPEASDTDGLSVPDFYIIDIPIYDANEQTGGANTGDNAVIHAYRDDEELIVKSPVDGIIVIGASDSLQLIHLTVESPYTSPPQYQLTASVSEGNGSVLPTSGIYDEGTEVTLTATPDDGYCVESWSGTDDDSSDSNTNIVTMNSDKFITVAFEEIPPQPPIADAGPDQVVDEGSAVTLSGLNSTDPDGTIDSFFWEQTEGEPVYISDPYAPEVSFTSPDVGMDGESLSFRLTVIDNDDSESWDECIVNVVWVNEPPIADAGPDQAVFSGDEVFLDAAMSSDIDDGIATYLWEQIDGPAVSLSGADSVQATFLAPNVDSAKIGGALTFVLTVTDNGDLKAVDTCVINVESWTNSPPCADAGPDQEVYEHDMVTLDGSGSTDYDDGIQSYIWTQKAGKPVTLSDTMVEKPTFYAPRVKKDGEVLIFELTVIDFGGLKSTAQCCVFVKRNRPEPPLTDFWVNSLTGGLIRRGLFYKAQTFVKVLDENHRPVKRAKVTVTWSFNGKNHYKTSSVTNWNGVAKFYSRSKRARSGDVFAIEVTGVDKEGYAYKPSSNAATTRSFIVPKRENHRRKPFWPWPFFFKTKSK
jgi:hypothetical protein